MTKDNLTELHGMFCDTIQEKSILGRRELIHVNMLRLRVN